LRVPEEGSRPAIPVLEGTLQDIDYAWNMYTLMEAFQWNFLPSQLEQEDEVLLNNIIRIAATVRRMQSKQKE
jgi:hypothetical protein